MRRRLRSFALLAIALVVAGASVALTLSLGRSVEGTEGDAPAQAREWLEYSYYIANLALLFIAVVSLLALSRQLAGLRRSHTVEMFDATASRMIQLSELSLGRAGLVDVMRDVGSAQSSAQLSDASKLCEAHIDYLDTELLRRKRFPTEVGGLPPLTPWIVDFFRQNELGRLLLEWNRDWYSYEIYNLMRRAQATADNEPAVSGAGLVLWIGADTMPCRRRLLVMREVELWGPTRGDGLRIDGRMFRVRSGPAIERSSFESPRCRIQRWRRWHGSPPTSEIRCQPS